LPRPGQRLDDFELLSVLGAGSFAKVYLAQQVSLGRQVALKVSRNRGQEARTLASLEHDHIVRVFSEVVDREHDLRLLCMQYVPGTTLEKVIESLAGRRQAGWAGRDFLAAIDALSQQTTTLDLAALRDRELLDRSDFVEAGCWLGARLAEALAHAHRLGVLHRDVKPANVLLSRYGRPLLADFNVSFLAPDKSSTGEDALFGGTLAYMAPEHLDAFNPAILAPPESVDARSDVYSLGVVLFELFTGRLPFPLPEQGPGDNSDYLRALAGQRRGAVPSLTQWVDVPPALDRVVRRCLAPAPADRYPSAADLASALQGCRELRGVERELPRGGAVTAFALRYPFLMGCLLMLLPQVLGSIVNISYNSLRIVEQLSPPQQSAFERLVLIYNALVYPLCLALLFRQIGPVLRTWRRLSSLAPITGPEVEQVRRRALRLPLWVIGLSCLGWLPCGLVFPLGVSALAGWVGLEVFGHFVLSFVISGLIALTYSVFAIQFIVLRVLYPRLWLDERSPCQVARGEVGAVEGRLRLLVFLAVLIPLAGAVLLLGVGPEQLQSSYSAFRLLVTALLALGMVGLGVALLASAELSRALSALTGTRNDR
jgi:serine/threonine protein kinase